MASLLVDPVVTKKSNDVRIFETVMSMDFTVDILDLLLGLTIFIQFDLLSLQLLKRRTSFYVSA